MDVLVTGAFGTVGTALTDHLAGDDRYEFTLLDVEPPEEHDERTDADVAVVTADVTDYDALRPHVEGQDAVVHLALVPGHGGHTDRSLGWSEGLAANLEGINNVFEAAVDAGVDSVVFASSHHAVGLVEVRNMPDIYFEGEPTIDETEPHRPDSRYGLTKSYGEDLGRLAAEAHGVRFYALRIGAVLPPERDHPYGYAERGVARGEFERDSEAYREQVGRLKALWQSRRDVAHLVDCCLRDDTVEWDQFYGVSDNDGRWLDDREHARETVGYEPQDNAAEWDGPPEA